MNFAGVRMDQGLLVTEILLRHPPCGKPFLEMPAHLASIEFLRSQRQEVSLASYDARMLSVARRMKITLHTL